VLVTVIAVCKLIINRIKDMNFSVFAGGGAYVPFKVGDKDVYHLQGVVSAANTANKICDTQQYAIYTNVMDYVEWIEQEIRKLLP